MLSVKDITAAAVKWTRNAASAGPSYEEGIRSPAAPQAEAAIAAKTAWEQGVQAAIARNGFANGLREAGTDKWARGALEKGVQRYAPGVSVSAPIYQAKTARFFDAIRNLTLNPRGPSGDPRNYGRSQKVGEALHDLKVGKK